jgi:hypothetical protein
MGQALTTEAIAECIRSGGVWETESNMELLDLVSIPVATDWMRRSRWNASISRRARLHQLRLQSRSSSLMVLLGAFDAVMMRRLSAGDLPRLDCEFARR